MTRQWLAQPGLMCRNHYLGEHAETHMFVRKMEAGYSLLGYQTGSMFFGAEFVKQRHDILAAGLSGHKTPLTITSDLMKKYPLTLPDEQDYKKSMSDLLGRCEECLERHRQFLLLYSNR